MSDETKSETILEEAQRLVYGDRQASYGHPADDYECTGRLFHALLDSAFRPWLREFARKMYERGALDERAEERDFSYEGADAPPLPKIDARLACLMMVAVKLSREVRQHKRDNCTDGAGYFACVDRIARREAGEE